VLQEFDALIASFSTWAKEKEGELTEEIKNINRELKSLAAKLADIEASAAALGIVGSIFFGVVGLLVSATIPFTSFLVVLGSQIYKSGFLINDDTGWRIDCDWCVFCHGDRSDYRSSSYVFPLSMLTTSVLISYIIRNKT
jgi:hypothetical protein